MEGVDLYGDLEDPFFFNDRPSQPPKQISETTIALIPGNTRVTELEQKNEKLKEQNKALRMNISCLYKTARSELDRKEALIDRLMTRVKKLETTQTNQPSQQTPSINRASTDSIGEAQLAAAAFYQAQLLLLANPACAPAMAGGTAGMDYSALSEYYMQSLGCTWNDRTPTTSDIEDPGTPLASDDEQGEDKERGGTLDAILGETKTCSKKPKRVTSKSDIRNRGEAERDKYRGKRSSSHSRLSPKRTPVSNSKSLTDIGRARDKDSTFLSNNGGLASSGKVVEVRRSRESSNGQSRDAGVRRNQRRSSSPATGKRSNHNHQSNKTYISADKHASRVNTKGEPLVHKTKTVPRRENRYQHSPRRDGHLSRKQRETKEPQREKVSIRRSRSKDSHSSTTSRSSSLLTRPRSPSHDKENFRRLPSISIRGQRQRREAVDKRSRGNSLEKRSREESLDKRSQRSNSSQSDLRDHLERRRDNRKRKHSCTPPQTESQQEVKHARTGSDVMEVLSAQCSRESSPLCLNSCSSVSHFSLSPDYDDIMAPPTPNADEILPYCTEVELCENSTVVYCDGGGCGQQSLFNTTCPPTPTSELEEGEEGVSTEGIEVKPLDYKDVNDYCRNESNTEAKKMDEGVFLNKTASDCLKEGSVDDSAELSEEDKLVVEVEENDFDLEEGEITDSDTECCEEEETRTIAMTTTKSKMVGEDRIDKERSHTKSQSYRSRETVEKPDNRRISNERGNNGITSSHRSSDGSARQRERCSPTARPSRHLPLSDRRNRNSPPSLKRRIELSRYDHVSHVVRKRSIDERLSHHHSSKHTCRRPNLS